MDTLPFLPYLPASTRPASLTSAPASAPAFSGEALPPFGDASIVRTWTDPVPDAPLATWLAGLLDGAAAWLNTQADRLRTPSGTHPASA